MKYYQKKIIKQKKTFNNAILDEPFDEMIDNVIRQFEHVLIGINYGKEIKQGHICK